MNTKWKSFVFALTLSALSLVVFPVAAQLQNADCEGLGIACPENSEGDTEANVQYINDTLRDIVNTFLGIVGTIAGAFVVYGGLLYITSAGDEDRAKRGKQTVIYAIVGLLIIGISAVIVNFTINVLGSGGSGNSS